MPDINPVTRTDLLASVSRSLDAQQKLRDAMASVAAEVSPRPPQPQTEAPAK